MTGRGGNGKPRPAFVYWELTTGCNLRCIHCREGTAAERPQDELSYGECCEVIDQFGAYAPVTVVFSGGEPLWRRDVFDLAHRAVRRGLRLGLATNGTLVDEAMAERIREAGFERVSVSLEGADRVTHDTFLGQPGAFDASIRGLECLRNVGVATGVETTVTYHNVHQLPEMVDLAGRLGAGSLDAFLLAPACRGLEIPDEENISREDVERVLTWLNSRSATPDLDVSVTCAQPYHRSMGHGRSRSPEPEEKPAPYPCQAGRTVCFLSHTGEVFPCRFLLLAAGSLREARFQQIWEEAPVFHALRAAVGPAGKCEFCECRHGCQGCWARSHTLPQRETAGTFRAGEPRSPLAAAPPESIPVEGRV